ncbi:hypothetical protein BH11BAC2_BH11BAC2_21810 [soil metagenome]
MKKDRFTKLFLICSFFFGTTVSFSQISPIIGDFSLYENRGNVYLNWQIIAGSNCNGIQIWRSTDSLEFTQIHDIPGVCGNISTPQNFDFTDKNPVKNKTNYYRLELGNTGPSEVLSIEIIAIENGFQVRPNPIADYAKIYFDNNINILSQLIIYNLHGQNIFSLATKENFFEVSTENLQSGIYFFTIGTEGGAPMAQGKIVVQH